MKTSEVRILIIDDESAIREMLRTHLSIAPYKILEAETGEGGLSKARSVHPHLIILDLGLPDKNGFEVLKELRQWTQVPVIVLTVNDDERIKVQLLDAGADDYLTKPFGLQELLARVRVSLRNRGLIEATALFQSGDLVVDLNQHQVYRQGNLVKLTNTEFELLRCLVREPGKVISQMHLLKQVWGAATEDQSHYLRIYINQLRKKIEVNPSQPQHILTEPGVGYRII